MADVEEAGEREVWGVIMLVNVRTADSMQWSSWYDVCGALWRTSIVFSVVSVDCVDFFSFAVLCRVLRWQGLVSNIKMI